MLEAVFVPLQPFSNVAKHLVNAFTNKSAAFACVRTGSFCARACVRASVCLFGCEICVYACVHLQMHTHMRPTPYRPDICNSRHFDPQMWGDPSRAPKWSQRGLLCIRFLFAPEQEANREKLLRCVHHQSGNQKWQELAEAFGDHKMAQ